MRGLSTLAVFVAGSACGLVAAGWLPGPHGPSAALTPTSAVREPVRGAIDADRPTLVHVAPAAEAPTKVAPEAVEVPVPVPPEPREARPARSPAEIAQRARHITAFVSGVGAYGAGILVDDAGHVLTCQHVIEGLEEIRVSFAEGAAFTARVIDRDPRLDVALLKISAERAAAPAFASILSVAPGDELYAMGAPRKMKFSFARGMVSYVGRPFDGVHYLQSDVALNGGSSGGPVFDRHGRVVAMSSFVVRDSEGLAFALPIEYALGRFSQHLETVPAPEGGGESAFESWLAERESEL